MNSIEKIQFMQIPEYDEELIKISLKNNEKIAIDSYKNIEKPIKHLKYDNCNVGLLTGFKNQITVIDLDFKDILMEEHIFIQEYGKKFIKKFNTFTVRSPSGGYHLYFKYLPDVKQTQNSKVGIDIRNDGGYIVCPPSSINGRSYEVVNNSSIKNMSIELIDFLNKTVYKTKKVKKEAKDDLVKVDVAITTAFDVKMTDDIMKTILDELPTDCEKKNDFRGSYSKWIQIMYACKFANTFNTFNEWSSGTIHGNYDKDELLRMWQHANGTIHNFIYLLKCAKIKNTFAYKRIPDNNFNNYKEINKAKLGKIFKPDTNYLIKSDTGTGKTTSFRNYINVENTPFISITSRIALSYEQFNDLTSEGLKVFHYQDRKFEYGNNIIITPESSILISSYDFSKYIIFMDEFDSIVKHVLTSDTLNGSRIQVFRCLIKMLATCKQFICVDADVSSVSKALLDYVKRDYKFIVNVFKNYKGIKVNVINDEDEFFEKLASKDKFLLCSDSKSSAEIMHLKLRADDDDIVVITSDSEKDYYKLDDYDKVIYSPKIIYGLDSVKTRDVFCYYTGLTISPSQMVQQIARCRNIVEVHIFYPNRLSKVPDFDVLNDAKEYQKKMLKAFNSDVDTAIKSKYPEQGDSDVLQYTYVDDSKLSDLFSDLYYRNAYIQDCYETNKYLHLMNILQNRGFEILDTDIKISTLNHKQERKQIYDDKMENFDPESVKVKKLNEYLKIPKKQLENHKELFIDRRALSHHINICRFFFQDNVDSLMKLAQRMDFDVTKCKDVTLKLNLLDDMLKKLKLKKKEIGDFQPEGKSLKKTKEIQDRYEGLFRIRKKNLDLSTDVNMYKEVCKIYGDLFDVTDAMQMRRNKTKMWFRSVNEEKLKEHKKLFEFRNDRKVVTKKLVRQ